VTGICPIHAHFPAGVADARRRGKAGFAAAHTYRAAAEPEAPDSGRHIQVVFRWYFGAIWFPEYVCVRPVRRPGGIVAARGAQYNPGATE
jgi:hypothetical protein